jgi:hypothetical protein
VDLLEFFTFTEGLPAGFSLLLSKKDQRAASDLNNYSFYLLLFLSASLLSTSNPS